MNKVKFKSLVDEHPDKRAPSATVNPKDLKFLNLVSVKLARKKLDCKSGFGLCDFKFFPKNSAKICRIAKNERFTSVSPQ